MKLKIEDSYYYRNAEFVSHKNEIVDRILSLITQLDHNFKIIERVDKEIKREGISSKELNTVIKKQLSSNFPGILSNSENEFEFLSYEEEYSFKHINPDYTGAFDFGFIDKRLHLYDCILYINSFLSKFIPESYEYLVQELPNKTPEIRMNVINDLNIVQNKHLQLQAVALESCFTFDLMSYKAILFDLNDDIEKIFFKKYKSDRLITSKEYDDKKKQYKKLIKEFKKFIDDNFSNQNTISINKKFPLILGEIQFANWALAKSDIDKLEKVNDIRQVDLVVYITASKSLSELISKQTVNFKTFVRTIESSPHIKYPVLVIGLGVE